MVGRRGVPLVGDKWSQRILWICAIGSAIGLYMVTVERHAQDQKKAMAEALRGWDDASEKSGGRAV